jgi:hypothetical protein
LLEILQEIRDRFEADVQTDQRPTCPGLNGPQAVQASRHDQALETSPRIADPEMAAALD